MQTWGVEEVVFGEAVNVLEVFDESLRVEKLHVLLPEPLDIHASPGGEVDNLLLNLSGAIKG